MIIWAQNHESSGKRGRRANQPPRQHVNANEQERLRFTPPAQHIAPAPSIHFDFVEKRVGGTVRRTRKRSSLRSVIGCAECLGGKERDGSSGEHWAGGRGVSAAFHMKAACCEGWMRSDGLDMRVNGENNNDWHGYGRETHTLRLQKWSVRRERKVWIVLPPLAYAAVRLRPSEWQSHPVPSRPVAALRYGNTSPWNLTTTDKSYAVKWSGSGSVSKTVTLITLTVRTWPYLATRTPRRGPPWFQKVSTPVDKSQTSICFVF